MGSVILEGGRAFFYWITVHKHSTICFYMCLI